MPRDLDAFAETVVLTIKTTLLPVLERLATTEQANKDLQARVLELSSLRDRVLTCETKAALAPPLDLDPIHRRLADLEARAPVPGPAGADGRDGLSGKDGEPGAAGALGPAGPKGDPGQPGAAGAAGVAGMAGEKGMQGLPGDRGPEGVPGPLGRDGRDGLAGMPGEKGLNGALGPAGKDGRDGTLEHLKVAYDGERTVTLCFKDGTPIDGGVLMFPVEIYRGVYVEGKTYERGDAVTWGGSEWHVNETTITKPGDGSKAWTLKVKRGRDGKDGRDAAGALPVVSIGAGGIGTGGAGGGPR